MVVPSFFQALLQTPFLLLALYAAFAASVAGGIMGSYVVVKRIVSISGSISHSVLGGMGLFLWLKRTYGWNALTPLQGALFAGLLSALIMGWIHLKYREREDTVIAALWAVGMSTGVIFISLTPGYNVELLNFLFGNILWVTHSDIGLLITLDCIILAVVVLFYRKFLAISFDETQALLQGISVKLTYLLLLCLIAVSVVLLIQVIGAILVIAMLAIPAAVAGMWTHKLSTMMLLAVALGCVFSTAGMYTAYAFNWPPGATIALLSAGVYTLSLLRKKKL
ncbi:MAG: metal ABC transporter permease [Chlamydiales bacterium]|nr:metal ABC transporter permease [Chlamydiales bacterium]